MANIKPRYEVHKLDGKRTRRICIPRVDDDGKPIGGFDYKEKEVDAGYMVYVPSRASIRVRDEAHLKELGFDVDAELVDMDSGDVVGKSSHGSLRSKSEQLNNRSRRQQKGVSSSLEA